MRESMCLCTTRHHTTCFSNLKPASTLMAKRRPSLAQQKRLTGLRARLGLECLLDSRACFTLNERLRPCLTVCDRKRSTPDLASHTDAETLLNQDLRPVASYPRRGLMQAACWAKAAAARRPQHVSMHIMHQYCPRPVVSHHLYAQLHDHDNVCIASRWTSGQERNCLCLSNSATVSASPTTTTLP